MKKIILPAAALMLSAIALTGCSSSSSPSSASTTAPSASAAAPAASAAAPAPKATAATRTVTYEVTGNGTKATDITYLTFNNGGSGESQANDAALPFTKVVPITSAKLFSTSIFSLVAQAGDGTSITCKITVDGKVIQQNTSTGQYAVATCSGSAG